MIIGVDPGHWGGIAMLSPWTNDAGVVAMPATSGHNYDIDAISAMLDGQPPDILVIERVTRPATLTRCMGIFEGIGTALGYRVETVRPQEWKGYFNLGRDKQLSLDLAKERFPILAHEFKRVTRDDGKAEALLLALFAKETRL